MRGGFQPNLRHVAATLVARDGTYSKSGLVMGNLGRVGERVGQIGVSFGLSMDNLT